jgi:hypothetical protein
MTMNAERTKSLNESIKGIEFEKGNVRKLATRLTSILLEHGAGKNPYELAWKIAKQVGKEYGANFSAKDVIKTIGDFKKEMAQKPEYDEDFFREQGQKGADSLTHEERVKYGHMGAESLTNIQEEA